MGPSREQPISAWGPTLWGEDALIARESATRVAEQLAAGAEADGFQLGAGEAGIALALAYLSRSLDRPDWLDAARSCWARALAQLAEAPAGPGLYSGFTGPAWVSAHFRDMLFDEPDDQAHEEIELILAHHLRSFDRYTGYDLISGLVGIGVYALERWPQGRAQEIVESTVAHLVRMSTPSDVGVAWLTPPELLPVWQVTNAPNGYWNMGLAHGIPAI